MTPQLLPSLFFRVVCVCDSVVILEPSCDQGATWSQQVPQKEKCTVSGFVILITFTTRRTAFFFLSVNYRIRRLIEKENSGIIVKLDTEPKLEIEKNKNKMKTDI